jgi:hypothetical protein
MHNVNRRQRRIARDGRPDSVTGLLFDLLVSLACYVSEFDEPARVWA